MTSELNSQQHPKSIRLYQIAFFLTVLTTYIFSDNEAYIFTWGAFILFVAMGCINLLINRSYIKLKSEILFFILFVVYSTISLFWAKFERGLSPRFLILMLIYLLLSDFLFYRKNNAEFLMDTLIIAGVCLSIYIPFKYGITEFFDGMLSGNRMGHEVIQENTLAVCMAFSATLSFARLLYYKKKWCIPCIILQMFICFSSGSRTGVFAVLVGYIMILFFYYYQTNKDKFVSLVKFTCGILATVIVLYFVLKYIPLFQIMYERFYEIVQYILGNESSAEGTEIRKTLIQIGFNEFMEYPLFGIGFANARYAVSQTIGVELHTHSNFIEILCNGGTVGFIIFYMIYGILIVKHIKRFKYKNPIVIISFTLLIVSLFIGISTLGYLQKYFYIFLIFWSYVANMTPKQLTKTSEDKNVDLA